MGHAFFIDDLFLEHNTGPSHPETAGRIEAIHNKLRAQQYYSNLYLLPRRFATKDEIATLHGRPYIDSVEEACAAHGGYLDGDTIVSAKSYDAALLAAGSGLVAADSILSGEAASASLFVRPPGHHSLQNRAMGFCLFNNVAICARYLQSQGHEKIAIVALNVTSSRQG